MDHNFNNAITLINNNPNNIFASPSFQSYLKEVQYEYECEKDDKIKFYLYGRTMSVVISLVQINKVWSNIPVDYFNNYRTVLESFLNLSSFSEDNVSKWFHKNMRVRSFFNMFHTYLKKKEIYEVNDLFSDTTRQLKTLINKGHGDKISIKRWRLVDFHDQISDIYIELTTEDKPLPTKSIKEPVTNGDYTIYQPNNMIELAKWGSRVHNCVLSRTEDILSKSSEVILIEENGRPFYTVEINAPAEREKNGIQIKEIKGPCNAMVPEEKIKMCVDLISIAMKKYN